MAKLLSPELEVTAIKTMAVSNITATSGLVFSSIDESYFHFPPAQAAFRRLSVVAKKRGEVLDFTDLLSDPAIDEDFRDQLRETDSRRIKGFERAQKLVARLGEYRKLRICYEAVNEVSSQLTASSVDIDQVIERLTEAVMRAHSKREQLDSNIISIGADFNQEGVKAMSDTLKAEADFLYKTGYTEFDERTGGFPTEGVILLAATTSGGKSIMLQNLLKQIHMLNKISVINISLEMQKHKLMNRHAAMLTGIPLTRFIKKEATAEEQRRARIAWKKLHQFGKDNDCTYAYSCPTEGVTMQQCLLGVKPRKFKVIGIDYAGLLDGMDGDDQWRKLSAAIREAKIYTSSSHCLVIILAQLDSDTSKLRYSKGMLEHADNAWFWNYAKPEVRELRSLPISQAKNRDGECYPFELEERFDIAQINNPSLHVSDEFAKSKDAADDTDRPKKKRTDDDSIPFDEDAGV